jgi:hypothetical protein
MNIIYHHGKYFKNSYCSMLDVLVNMVCMVNDGLYMGKKIKLLTMAHVM